ncbi:MAG: fluoride efflux transporter CrcB [Bacteroides sp.]|nr:fluoride efflux transporter CrcB [Lachnospiraceae bacterium]MCM1332674.1 fluoride efflux transporter CrcB [Bacteroides sp.]MCM1390380.1 fluoride efflux transporter CrcB [Bacteroides sp.]
MLKTIALIGIGSCLGGIARYGVTKTATHIIGIQSMWGTFAANMLGCLLIGIFYGIFERHNMIGEHWRLLFTVGFCGGFTTFSTFIHENYSIFSDGRFLHAALYTAVSLFLGLIMVYLGHLMTR